MIISIVKKKKYMLFSWKSPKKYNNIRNQSIMISLLVIFYDKDIFHL